ncbi:MAG: hypothetical protein FK733_08505 [Asgard group archaeon]|nr:hypothetical protein [Asgard group archaeon]
MRKKIFYCIIIIHLFGGMVSQTILSINTFDTKTVNSLELIHDNNYRTNGIFCGGDISDIYFNNDYLFLENENIYNKTLEIYDVSSPQEIELLKTFVHPSLGCYYYTPNNCLAGNNNYTFVLAEEYSNIEENTVYQSAIIAFDINSPELTHITVDLPSSNYSISQFIADNDYLYLVREHFDHWTYDWQIEKYEISNPFSLSLVSNVSVSDKCYIYVREDNLFRFIKGDINNWSNPYGSSNCFIKDAFFGNNKLYVLMQDNHYSEGYFSGLLALDVIDSNNFQIIDSYPMDYIVNFDVINSIIYIASMNEIIALELIDYSNLEKVSSYSFEYILGELRIMCKGKNLLFVSKLSCSGRYFGDKPEDETTLIIFDVQNPHNIEAVYPEGFDNGYDFFADGGFFANILFYPVVFITAAAVSVVVIVMIVVIIKKYKLKKEDKINI